LGLLDGLQEAASQIEATLSLCFEQTHGVSMQEMRLSFRTAPLIGLALPFKRRRYAKFLLTAFLYLSEITLALPALWTSGSCYMLRYINIVYHLLPALHLAPRYFCIEQVTYLWLTAYIVRIKIVKDSKNRPSEIKVISSIDDIKPT
jgi:hypothetical protein